MKEFYLMRHGQTRFNVQHRLQGVCDAPLTEIGIEQAKKAGQYLAKQEPIFDHVFTSTSERASDTLEIVTGRTDYERLKGLKGQDFGAFEGQPEYLHPKTSIVGHFGDHYAQFGGESQDQFVARVVSSAREMVDKHPDQSILAVSHAGALMTFLHAVEPERAFESCPGNCAILVFDYDGSSFHFVKLIDPIADQELVEF